ncbi:hypothetical protein LY78DRAFT_117339 [Colletotrichum sublineola]|nr:hypothetical protein LY78DRAFT_117339 [Colletotrichum sublineola]
MPKTMIATPNSFHLAVQTRFPLCAIHEPAHATLTPFPRDSFGPRVPVSLSRDSYKQPILSARKSKSVVVSQRWPTEGWASVRRRGRSTACSLFYMRLLDAWYAPCWTKSSVGESVGWLGRMAKAFPTLSVTCSSIERLTGNAAMDRKQALRLRGPVA